MSSSTKSRPKGGSSGKASSLTAKALNEETRRAFADTVRGMLAALCTVWEEDRLLEAAVTEWVDKIDNAATSRLRRTRIDVCMRLLSDRCTDEMMALLNARDIAFWDRIESVAAAEHAKQPTAVRAFAAFAAAISSGRHDLLSTLGIGRRLRAGDLDEESIANVWGWTDRLMNSVVMLRIKDTLAPSVLDVVARVQDSIRAQQTSGGADMDAIGLISQIANDVQSIPQGDMGKLMGSLNADSVQVLLRNMGTTTPGVGQAMQHMQEALRQHGEASKAQGGGGEA